MEDYFLMKQQGEKIYGDIEGYPIIGLCCCVEVQTENEFYFLCLICGKKLVKDLILAHLKSTPHMTKFSSKLGLGFQERCTENEKLNTKLFLELMLQYENRFGRGRMMVCEEKDKKLVMDRFAKLTPMQIKQMQNKLNAKTKAPEPTKRITKQVWIPQDEYPDVNFLQVLDPNFVHMRYLERKYQVQLSLRGTALDGKVKGVEWEYRNEMLHLSVTSTDEDDINGCCIELRHITKILIEEYKFHDSFEARNLTYELLVRASDENLAEMEMDELNAIFDCEKNRIKNIIRIPTLGFIHLLFANSRDADKFQKIEVLNDNTNNPIHISSVCLSDINILKRRADPTVEYDLKDIINIDKSKKTDFLLSKMPKRCTTSENTATFFSLLDALLVFNEMNLKFYPDDGIMLHFTPSVHRNHNYRLYHMLVKYDENCVDHATMIKFIVSNIPFVRTRTWNDKIIFSYASRKARSEVLHQIQEANLGLDARSISHTSSFKQFANSENYSMVIPNIDNKGIRQLTDILESKFPNYTTCSDKKGNFILSFMGYNHFKAAWFNLRCMKINEKMILPGFKLGKKSSAMELYKIEVNKLPPSVTKDIFYEAIKDFISYEEFEFDEKTKHAYMYFLYVFHFFSVYMHLKKVLKKYPNCVLSIDPRNEYNEYNFNRKKILLEASNIPSDMSYTDIRCHFEQYGPVKRIIELNDTNEAYIEYFEAKSAVKAMEDNGMAHMNIDWAVGCSPSAQDDDSTSVYLTGLVDCEELYIRLLCNRFGYVKNVHLGLGEGIVVFESVSDAVFAVKELHLMCINGYHIYAHLVRNPPEHEYKYRQYFGSYIVYLRLNSTEALSGNLINYVWSLEPIMVHFCERTSALHLHFSTDSDAINAFSTLQEAKADNSLKFNILMQSIHYNETDALKKCLMGNAVAVTNIPDNMVETDYIEKLFSRIGEVHFVQFKRNQAIVIYGNISAAFEAFVYFDGFEIEENHFLKVKIGTSFEEITPRVLECKHFKRMNHNFSNIRTIVESNQYVNSKLPIQEINVESNERNKRNRKEHDFDHKRIREDDKDSKNEYRGVKPFREKHRRDTSMPRPENRRNSQGNSFATDRFKGDYQHKNGSTKNNSTNSCWGNSQNSQDRNKDESLRDEIKKYRSRDKNEEHSFSNKQSSNSSHHNRNQREQYNDFNKFNKFESKGTSSKNTNYNSNITRSDKYHTPEKKSNPLKRIYPSPEDAVKKKLPTNFPEGDNHKPIQLGLPSETYNPKPKQQRHFDKSFEPNFQKGNQPSHFGRPTEPNYHKPSKQVHFDLMSQQNHQKGSQQRHFNQTLEPNYRSHDKQVHFDQQHSNINLEKPLSSNQEDSKKSYNPWADFNQ